MTPSATHPAPSADSIPPADPVPPTHTALPPVVTQAPATAPPDAAPTVDGERGAGEARRVWPEGHVPRQFAAPPPAAWDRRAPRLRPTRAIIAVGAASLAGVLCWYAWADAWALVYLGGPNGHVMLAPFVVATLVWVRRARMPFLRVSGQWLGLGIMAIGTLFLRYGEFVYFESLFHLGALLVSIGAFAAICGRGVLLRFLPAALALLFLIPVPGRVRNWIEPPLREATQTLVAGSINLLGGTAEVERYGPGPEDDRIHVEREASDAAGPFGRSWQAVPTEWTCNGTPMALGLFLVTYGFVFAYPIRNRYRALILLLSPIVTLLYNVARSLPIVWGYGAAGPGEGDWARRLAEFMMAYGGWLMLPVAFVLLLGVLQLLKWFDLRVERYRLAA